MRIPRDLREALEAEAKADDRSLNSLIVHTLRSSIKGQPSRRTHRDRRKGGAVMSWRDQIPIHPAADLFPLLADQAKAEAEVG